MYRLTHFITSVSFYNPRKHQKTEECFYGVKKQTSGMKWVKDLKTYLVYSLLYHIQFQKKDKQCLAFRYGSSSILVVENNYFFKK